jgi:hypothetical protein
MVGANTMKFSAPQDAPRALCASQTVTTAPPFMSVVFSLAWEKNPMLRLSGDQKGKDPSFVPGSGVYVPVVV